MAAVAPTRSIEKSSDKNIKNTRRRAPFGGTESDNKYSPVAQRVRVRVHVRQPLLCKERRRSSRAVLKTEEFVGGEHTRRRGEEASTHVHAREEASRPTVKLVCDPRRRIYLLLIFSSLCDAWHPLMLRIGSRCRGISL